MSAGTVYEIRCDSCDVSFPPGTKSCLHCKQRLGRHPSRSLAVQTLRGPAALGETGDRIEPLADGFRWKPPVPGELADLTRPDSDSPEEPEGSPVRTALRLGVNALWILGAILITALQMCRGG